MAKIVIHKNPSLLRHKLVKLEPRELDSRDPLVAFGVHKLEFRDDIPILKEQHIESYYNRPKSPKPIAKLIIKTPTRTPTKSPQKQRHDKSSSERLDIDCLNKRKASDHHAQDDNPVIIEKHDHYAICPSPVLSVLSTASQEDQQLSCESNVDKLVLNGPEDDEFKRFDDENDEAESTISKNLKKIRVEPVKPPVTFQQPFTTHTAEPRARSSPLPKQSKPAPEVELQKARTPEDLEKSVDQKEWHLVYTELDWNRNSYKTNEVARSVLKKAVFSCLDLDETYKLINFMKLVFEFEYPEDANFWEMLIGKLKRKVSPHVLDHRFKCDTDPKLVINNYTLVIQEILKHFNSSNKMSNVKIPFHLAAYLTMWGSDRETTQLRPSNIPTTALIQPMPPVVQVTKDTSPGNQELDTNFDVSLIKLANGNSHFKIKSSRRDSKFSPKFL